MFHVKHLHLSEQPWRLGSAQDPACALGALCSLACGAPSEACNSGVSMFHVKRHAQSMRGGRGLDAVVAMTRSHGTVVAKGKPSHYWTNRSVRRRHQRSEVLWLRCCVSSAANLVILLLVA